MVASAPTVGSNYERYEWKGVNFGLIDIGGQTSLRSSWSQYFVGTSAIILVIDSSDAGRLPLAKAELDKLTQAEVRRSYVTKAETDEIGTQIIITTGPCE